MLERYSRFHSEAVAKCLSEPLRVIVYSPSSVGEGWGNRVLSLSSALALALTTRRALFVNWTEPVPIHRILDSPPGVDWLFQNLPEECAARLYEGKAATFELEALFKQRSEILSPDGGPSAVMFSSLHDLFRGVKALPEFAWLRKTCALERDRAGAGSDRGAGEGSGDGAVGMGEKLSKWELFGCTGPWLFRPASGIVKGVAAELERIRTRGGPGKGGREGGGRVVGAAVRRGSPETSHYSVLHQMGEDNVRFCASLLLSAYGPESSMYLTTDSAPVRDRFSKAMGERVTYLNGSIGYSGSAEKQRAFSRESQSRSVMGEQEEGDDPIPDATRDAVVEWFVLGALDDAILSEGSTFGQTGWARTMQRKAIEVGNHDLRCVRRWGDDPDEVVRARQAACVRRVADCTRPQARQRTSKGFRITLKR
ncbi:hypothetical protein T484DRAFT_1893102 [Baffinella frigidus]|nr:hypothetical protein T484DRAFT_1893102 [Cryptophyta sp. CCMP2293]